jgi:hypothetical protein
MLCPLLFQEHERPKARTPVADNAERSSGKRHTCSLAGELAEMAGMHSSAGKARTVFGLNAEFVPGKFWRSTWARSAGAKWWRRTSFMSFAGDPENYKPLSIRKLHYTIFDCCQLESFQLCCGSTT